MDPDRMAAREKKFGKPLLTAAAAKKDPKDPEAMRKRAQKFGKPLVPPAAAGATADDEARKKVRGAG
jgi:hypothetical protein